VKDALASKQPIYPIGGNTQSHWLAPITKPGVTISTTGLHRLIDFPAEDMTVTVEAGMTLQRLQQLLHEKRMWLPLDVPDVEYATVGGSLAANVQGPRRTGFGTWRDYVLGIHWINDQGESVKAGGRVVKNVAGYDFCKLLIGSLGTLGIITQVTLKVRPLPESCATITGNISGTELTAWCHSLRRSGLRPSVAVLKHAGDHWNATLAFEDSQAAVDWQLEKASQPTNPQTNSIDGVLLPEGETSKKEAAHAAIQSLDHTGTMSAIRWQATLPRGQSASWAIAHANDVLQLHPLVGLVTGHIPGDKLETVRERLAVLRASATASAGHLILTHCPDDWRTTLQPYGPPRPDWHLMRRIKHTLDPNHCFQPGRYEVLHGE
jgi:glycolate oxidase FAD binding subunit